ncbi:MAG: hypothetical protein K8T89_17580 [Planctomycetes bacterium]|nr:hypothetical protein [Planctomycetota bacterium]
MPDNQRPRDKWRHGSGQPSPAGPRPARSGSSGKGKLFLGALVLAAIVGVVIGLLTFFRSPPKPIFLSIAITEYADRNFPVNAFAQQDGEALRKHFGADSVQAFQSQERELILRELNLLADRSSNKDKGRPIVVHLSANAFAQGGTVYVLPGNAKAGVAGTAIRLEEILDILKRAKGDRVLMLDLRPVVDARLGLVADDLSETVQATLARLTEAKDLSFQVLVACGPGSSPLVVRELNRSAFGWFLDRGLAGMSDGWNGENKKDERVTTPELLSYARENVGIFSNRLRPPMQLPALHGTGNDFVLLPVPQTGPPAASSPQAVDEYPEWLLAAWKERDRWREEGTQRRLPRTFRHLEAVLLRAESQWLGGVEQAKAQSELDNELRELRAVKQANPEPIAPMRSLVRVPRKNRDETKAILQALLDRIKATPAPKMEDLAEFMKLRMALREKPPEPVAAAAVLFDFALELKEPTLDQFKQIVESLPPQARFAETVMLRMVTQVEPKRLKLWEPDAATIPLILLAANAAEQAVAFEGRALPWIAKDLRETDALRREAMLKLLTEEADAREVARKQLDECRKRYAANEDAGKGLEAAFRELDETRVFLAAWAGFEAPDPRIQQELEKLWGSIVGECRTLTPLLNPPTAPHLPDTQQLRNKANDLRFRRERVFDLVRVPSGASALDVQRWLAWPFWPADQRARLASRIRETGVAPVQQALQSPPDKPGKIDAPSIDQGARNKLALQRARQAIDLLILAGDVETEKLESRYDAVVKNPDSRGFDELGQAISRRWSEQLPEAYKQAKSRLEQTQTGWAIHPFDLSALPRSGDTFPRDAAADSFKQHQRAFAAALGELRDQLDARAYRTVEGPGALTLSVALEELARDQVAWPP